MSVSSCQWCHLSIWNNGTSWHLACGATEIEFEKVNGDVSLAGNHDLVSQDNSHILLQIM